MAVWYQDPVKAIDWLCQAFGFEVRLKIQDDDGKIVHSELTFGDGVVMVGGEKEHPRRSPKSLDGANTQSMMVYVDDVEAHCARARAAGATIVTDLKVSDYGPDYWTDRSYDCADLEGHRWYFCQRLK
jgi:uncharacterized glyoxalase superfamily protein PhnB